MITGERRHGGASASVCVPSALPRRMRGTIVELRRLYTRPQHRGQGHAAELLRQIIADADADRTMIMLHVDEGEGKQRLLSFYERNGFVPIQADPLLMVRAHKGMVNG